MVRILVTVSPRMYREVIALSIHRHRPGAEVKMAPPEAAAVELAGFRPHLLVYNDTAPIPGAALAEVPCRMEVMYSDSMDARVSGIGVGTREARDVSAEDLLRAVDGAASLLGRS